MLVYLPSPWWTTGNLGIYIKHKHRISIAPPEIWGGAVQNSTTIINFILHCMNFHFKIQNVLDIFFKNIMILQWLVFKDNSSRIQCLILIFYETVTYPKHLVLQCGEWKKNRKLKVITLIDTTCKKRSYFEMQDTLKSLKIASESLTGKKYQVRRN